MNVVQALAVAAAALTLAGEPVGASVARTQERLAALAGHGEAMMHRLTAQAQAKGADEGCGKDRTARDMETARHAAGAPADASIHRFMGAARL